MSNDLDTLLRDAGRGPTIDLDVDSVHTRGRRRALTRRVAVGTGALVLLGTLVVGMPQLFGADRPGLDPIDDAPPTDVPADDLDGAVSSGTTPRAALAAELGSDLQLHRYDVADDTWTVERTGRDGSSDTRRLSLPPMLGDPVVDLVGALWSSDVDGNLLRDGEAPPEQDPELVGAWLPIGTDGAGNVVVVAQPGSGGGGPADEALLHTVGTDGLVASSDLDLVTAALSTDASVFALDEGREHAVMLGAVAPQAPGDAEQVLLLVRYGGDPRDLLAEQPVADAVGDGTVAAVQIVGDEVWLAVIEPDDSTSRIVRVPLDAAGEVTVLPTADPEGSNRLAGQVHAIAATDDGRVVLLGRRDGDEFLAPYVVRPEMADALADGAITELDARGVPTLLPATGDTGPLAACATEADGAYINARPLPEQTALYYLCMDATAQLPDGVAYPFAISERIAAPVETTDAASLLQLLRTWAAGPTPQEAEAGLSGGLDEGVATIADVTVDGTQVTVDLVPGEQVGMLSTTYASGAFSGAVVGMVLQYEQFDTIRFTLDGSCEGFGGLVESSACVIYDEAFAPWNQGPSACGLDLDAVNARPTPGEVVVWRWCPGAAAALPADAPGEAFIAVPSGVAVSDPPTAGELRELVAASLAPAGADEAARGLEPAAGVSRLPDTDDLAVVVDGGTVTIDWSEDYVEVLPLSAPFPAGLLETALAGAVLQFDAFDRVVFAIDGSCEAYGATGEAMLGACIRIDRDHVLWAAIGSGGPAGAEDLRDGRIAALLSGVEPELGVVSVDVVQYLTGSDAEAAYAEDTGETDGPPNDYWIRNEDVFPEGVGVHPEADVQLVRLREDGDADLDPGSLHELPDYLQDYGGEILVWLTVVNGEVTAIEEQYVP